MTKKAAAQQKNRLLRRDEVEILTGKSRSAIYAAIKKGAFPAPIQIGVNSVAWLEEEVNEWIQQRIEQRQIKQSFREV